MRLSLFQVLLWATLISLILGCGPSTKENPLPAKKENPITKTFTLGGAPVRVRIKLSTDELDLTDYLVVTIQTEYSEETRVTPPYLSETVYSPLILVKNPKERTFWNKSGGGLINEWVYTFEPSQSGEFWLNPFSIYFRLEKEKNDDLSQWPAYQIQTEKISYKVNKVNLTDGDDIRDIKGMILPPYNFYPLLVTLFSLSLIGTLVWARERNKDRWNREEIQKQPKMDYYSHALRKLEELERQDLIGQKKFETFHIELSNVLRHYIENFLGLRAVEQTTDEFIKEITATQHFTTDQRKILNRFLRLADLVKFATFDPGSDSSLKALESVRSFILATGKVNET